MKKCICILVFALLNNANALEVEDVYGSWVTDVDGFVYANSNIIEQIPEYAIKQMRSDPMTVTIDDKMFMSVTSVETVFESFRLAESKHDSVLNVVFLESNGEVGRRGVLLRLVDGRLLLKNVGSEIILVFRKVVGPATDAKDAKDAESQKPQPAPLVVEDVSK
jgi:hypothetical protein